MTGRYLIRIDSADRRTHGWQARRYRRDGTYASRFFGDQLYGARARAIAARWRDGKPLGLDRTWLAARRRKVAAAAGRKAGITRRRRRHQGRGR